MKVYLILEENSSNFPVEHYITWKLELVSHILWVIVVLVKPVYNLLEYSSSYSDTAGNLWFYSKDEATNFNNAIAADDDTFKSFKYKTRLAGSTWGTNRILKNETVAVPLKKSQ